MNSFQVSRNNKMMHDASAGAANGKIILINTWESVAPSMMAASLISCGICSKNDRNISVAIGIENPIYGNMTAR